MSKLAYHRGKHCETISCLCDCYATEACWTDPSHISRLFIG